MQYALLGSGGYGEASGVVRIGAGEIAAPSCLPAFVAGLKADMPHVGLETEIDLTTNLIQQFVTGRTDMAFAAGPIAPDRKRVVSGQRRSVRVELGGRRIINKKHIAHNEKNTDRK